MFALRGPSVDDNIYNELFAILKHTINFDSIFYYSPERIECHSERQLASIGEEAGVFQWRKDDSMYLNNVVNMQSLLVLACLPGIFRQQQLLRLSHSLRFIRQAKILIELAPAENVTVSHSVLTQVLMFCKQKDMFKTVLIESNFAETQTLHSFSAYPGFSLSSQRFQRQAEQLQQLFADQTQNLHGYSLRTFPDLSESNTILYHDAERRPKLMGYVWNMLEEYAKKHNATLRLIAEPIAGKTLSHIQVLDLAKNDMVDLAAAVQPMSLRYLERFHEYAYPVHISSWCTMVPMEELISVPQIFRWTLPGQTVCFLMLLYFIYTLLPSVLGERARSLFGRHWEKSRFYMIGWLALTMLLLCNYQGRLLWCFMSPPSDVPLDSFASLYNSKIRVFGLRSEYNSYDFDMRTRFATVFRLSDQGSELIRLRNTLNTSYAYTVTYTKWQLYAEQQRLSTRPLFRYAKAMCYYEWAPFALVIPENSPHRVALHHYMLELGASGLFEHWVRNSFYYMVKAGRLKIQDLSPPREWQPLDIENLSFVIEGYAGGLLISWTVFIWEMLIYKFSLWLTAQI